MNSIGSTCVAIDEIRFEIYKVSLSLEHVSNYQMCIREQKICFLLMPNQNKSYWEFPGGPVVRSRGHRFNPGWGTEMPHATYDGQKKKFVFKNKSSLILLNEYTLKIYFN